MTLLLVNGALLSIAALWATLLAIVRPANGPLIWITVIAAAICAPFFPLLLLGQI